MEGLGRAASTRRGSGADVVCKAGFGAFLYLEMLDASFSFDGVVGAFALSSNLFIIAIGLGIGAFYIRAMTIMLAEKQTLAEYRYLEHGAFYAILVLARDHVRAGPCPRARDADGARRRGADPAVALLLGDVQPAEPRARRDAHELRGTAASRDYFRFSSKKVTSRFQWRSAPLSSKAPWSGTAQPCPIPT